MEILAPPRGAEGWILVQGRGVLGVLSWAGVRLAGLLMVCIHQVPPKKLLNLCGSVITLRTVEAFLSADRIVVANDLTARS
jgi:hypothetical protein